MKIHTSEEIFRESRFRRVVDRIRRLITRGESAKVGALDLKVGTVKRNKEKG